MLERRLLIQSGQQSAGLPRQNFFDDLAGLADNEKRAGLAKGQLHFFRRRLGQHAFQGVVGVGQAGQKLAHRKVIGRHHQGGEFGLADFLGFERFPGLDPFLPDRRQVRGQLRGVVPGVEKKNRGVMPVGIGGMIHRDNREGDLALGQSLVVGEMDAQLAFQRLHRGGLQPGLEFILEGLDRRIAPQTAQG